MRSGAGRRLVGALAICAALALAPVGAADAATIVVGATQDAANGSFDDPGCTLRDAIQAANTNTSEPLNGCIGDNAGADTIVLQGGLTYNLQVHGVDDTNAKGDLDITGPVTIRSSGPGLATIDANSNTSPGPPTGADRAIDVRPTAGSVTLEGLRIQDGLADTGAATFGGGGGILDEADLTLRDSEVRFNQAQGTVLVLGGGIYTRGTLGRLTVIGSTIADNKAISSGGGSSEAVGGGVASYEGSPALTMTNSTVTGNSVVGSGVAGGVFAGDGEHHGLATMANVTIVGNTSNSSTGGIEIFGGTMTGMIIAGNTEPAPIQHPDCYGGSTSGGGNILGNEGEFEFDCGFSQPTDLLGTMAAPINPNLGTLVDNGGPTKTIAPNPGSPAIDRGATCPATDQRGFFRAAAGACDSGAVEVGATVTPPPPPPPTPSVPAAIAPLLAPMQPQPTGRRAAALARCKAKKTKKARNRCRRNARKLPL